jgi:DNA-binding transcriptional LysR family regulator
MEFAQLAMFKAVADQGSIVRAAELLHCVPSNITNRIKLLERELGVSLFIRKGRGWTGPNKTGHRHPVNLMPFSCA